MKYARCLLFALLAFMFTSPLSACTTAIVSGKYTSDGRPLLFKNRDTGNSRNKLVYFDDGEYDYIGVVNASDSLGARVWQGCNSAGFAIMNSVSSNLNVGDTTKVKDMDNGIFMKLALEKCASLDDFERFLDEQPKPLGVQANFGVIDAYGGAAYYESGNSGYVKIDANDPKIAPFGYIVRTNYSNTGERDKGHGYIRYSTAEELFYRAAAVNDLSYRFILKDVARCLKHSLTGVDLTGSLPENGDRMQFVPFEDFIPRFTTASVTIVQGIREGEPPELSTIWTVIGFPLCSVAVPTWVAGGDTLPKIVTGENTDRAPLEMMTAELKDRCFPIRRGSGNKYLNLAAVANRKNTGILQKLAPLEKEILDETDGKLKKWREKGASRRSIRNHYKWIDKTVTKGYGDLFGIEQ